METVPKHLQLEKQLWSQGKQNIAGVDEAGRGPLAGPVVAAAVVIDKDDIIRPLGNKA